MANSEHLQILQQGVETWNTWQHQNEDISPDLSSANLAGANLSVITKATEEASRIIDHRTEGDLGRRMRRATAASQGSSLAGLWPLGH
jgi:hypothetical protein